MEEQKVFRLGDYYPIPFSEKTCIALKLYLEKERSVPYLPYETPDLNPTELNHLNYLLLSIDAYYSQKNKYHTKRKDLIPLIMNYDGAKTLKRIRLKSFLQTHGDTLLEEPSWWKETRNVYIEDIGEIYNYNYAMYWEAKDEQDYLLSQLPVNVDQEIVDQFITFINKIISNCDDFQEIKTEEILFKVSSSKALEKGKSVPHWSIKSSNMDFSEKRKPGRRCLITTGPGSGRDAIINNVNDLNTIQLINENVRSFIENNFPKNILKGSYEKVKRKYFSRCKKSKGFYCRDIKKEGITKPKWILREILKALNKRYPECIAFHYPYFFDGPWFEGDKGERGHGLGMANELTTLMQILIFKFTNIYLGDEGEYITATKAFFLNDDAIIFFDDDSEDQIETFADYDFHVCQSLGLMAQKDKSFISRICCVFCEMYYSRRHNTLNDKESYVLRENSIILRAGTILEAKFLLGNMKGSLSEIENTLKKVYSKIGYEFHPDEIDWPISFGGCRPMKLRGTDFSLMMIENCRSTKTLFNAYKANKLRRLWKYDKLIKNYVHPILVYYPSLLKEDSNLLERIGITSDFQLSCMFFRPTKERKFHSSIEKLGRKRLKIYKELESPPILEDIYSIYCKESLSNIALPERFYERKIRVKQFIFKDFKDPYTIKNPITSFLNFLKLRNEENEPATTWGLFNTDASLLNEKSVFARARTMNTLSLIDRFEEDFESDILVFPEDPNDIKDFMESYPKPFLTSELVREGNLLPIPKQKFRNEELWRRREVFSEYLKFHHIILAQTRTWRELRYIIEFERREPNFEYDVEFWDDVFKKRDQKLEDPTKKDFYQSSSDSDDSDDPSKGYIRIFSQGEINVTMSIDLARNIPEPISEPVKVESPIEKKKELTQEEKDKNNPFLIEHGPLEEGDISVYGSTGWIEWLVTEDVLTIEDYCENDPELNRATRDILMYKRKVGHTSNIMQHLTDEMNVLLDESKEWSWVSLYFYNYIHTVDDEDEEIPDFDVFG